jgi:hypothetical protein
MITIIVIMTTDIRMRILCKLQMHKLYLQGQLSSKLNTYTIYPTEDIIFRLNIWVNGAYFPINIIKVAIKCSNTHSE